MAAVDIVSFKVRDEFNKTRNVPIAIASGATQANIQTWAQAVELALDAVMDGYVEAITVELNIPLNAGKKTAATGGNRVGVGARLTYDVTDSDYSDSVFVPTWEDAGFAGENVLVTTPYSTLEDLLHTATNGITATNGDGLAYADFLRGAYAQRK
jgi:hypothetical protein